MIEILNVNKYFNKGKKNEIHVINNTTLTLPDSGLVALLGESGCGKTTLLNAIGGLDKVKNGKIFINGQNITTRNVYAVDRIRNLSVGYIFQDYKLIEDMTVFDNVAIALKMVGIKDKNEIQERVEYVLSRLGMYRFRSRPAAMLSGGERQRVGIARALVKNPDIILADEPTGNLDSKNSVEIMNIIKNISRNRLVILVTHERKLADFYADRVVELLDGQVIKDYENIHNDELDYEIDTVFYLKDFKNQDDLSNKKHDIRVFSNTDEKIQIDVIFKNGNIYIQSKNGVNVEAIDDKSAIEVVDDHKQATTKDSVSKNDFDLSTVGNQNIKYKYSSIFNPITGIIAGYKKIVGFSTLKKMLLIGFVFVGVFVVYAMGSIGGAIHIEEKDYIQSNKAYITVQKPKLTVEEFKKFEQMEGVKYVLPVNAKQTLIVKYDEYYQTLGVTYPLTACLASFDSVDDLNVVAGKLPSNNKEIVIDTLVADEILSDPTSIMSGILSYEKIIGRTAILKNEMEYTISGIVDTTNPCIFVDSSELITMLYYNNIGSEVMDTKYFGNFGDIDVDTRDNFDTEELTNYKLYEDKIKLLKRSNWPVNDYEVIIHEEFKDIPEYKIGKLLNVKVNGEKLKIVGYYSSSEQIRGLFTNENTIKYRLIDATREFTICTDNKAGLIEELEALQYNVFDNLEREKTEFEKQRREQMKTIIIISAIILVISFIEMFLMIRSSFLSRIKEVGTLRAIGAKKTDIYKMFAGEIVVITTMTTLFGMLSTFLLVKTLPSDSQMVDDLFHLPNIYFILGVVVVYALNLLFGLIPVWNTMRKRPAEILARYDVD
ncbi:MAG: ABC transporter ATP-binding protein/permease [Ruminococcaceae bacterium]|nr:ABC transporter ATP-binding protein/permease [Oscillospiraceae bacterium]